MNKKIIGGIIIAIGAIVFIFIKQKGSASLYQTSDGSMTTALTPYTMAQISTHSNSSSCWMVISGKVYDVTGYIPVHPNTQILDGCGKDATDIFNNVARHGRKATGMLPNYLIGTLSN